MRFAVILAGGSGTRLWPMSRSYMPKQLLLLINGRSLLDLSYSRLKGLVENDRRFVCAGEAHRDAVLKGLPALIPTNYLGEPSGRDTLNAIAYAVAVIARLDPDATVGVFTADALISPDERFREIVSAGYEIAEQASDAIVTFGIAPTHAATQFGYLQLGERQVKSARVVTQFREKPEMAAAQRWVSAGPSRYLWNSGIFVFQSATFLECVRRYEPESYAGVLRIAQDWGSDRFRDTIDTVYPTLKKISIDYAVMEKATCDPSLRVVAVPMDISWTDIGSWPAFADTCAVDSTGNAGAAEQSVFVDTSGTFIASSDPAHLVTVVGCQDLIVVHTPDATLVCKRDQAEEVKKLQTIVSDRFGARYV